MACGNGSASGSRISAPDMHSGSVILDTTFLPTLLECPPYSEIKGLWSSLGGEADLKLSKDQKVRMRGVRALISDFSSQATASSKGASCKHSPNPKLLIGPRFGQHPQKQNTLASHLMLGQRIASKQDDVAASGRALHFPGTSGLLDQRR